MALNGCLQIILIVAVAFLGLYFLQNMSGRSLSPGMMPARMAQTEENFGGYEINPTRYDVPPNEALASRLNMPQSCGCQGPCDCKFTPAPAPACNDSGAFPNAPSCPRQVVDQCSDYPDGGQDLVQASCFPRSQLTPEELLPSDECNVWSKSNPYGAGSLADRNFLQAGWATGVSTVGSTLRNANLQLRSDPPNPQQKVSPWLQTTIAPDFGRKPLELGGCA